MQNRHDKPGLKPRLEAAFHLRKVLDGAPFSPITTDRIGDSRDRALANKLVTTALRRQGQISHILGETLAKGVPQRAGILEAVLRLGIAQLLYIEDIPAHSALDLAVDMARADKRAGRFDKLVNGVLRTIQRRADEFAGLSDTLLIPEWLRSRWEAAYGENALAVFAQRLVETPPLDLTLKDVTPQRVEALGGEVVHKTTVRLASRDMAITDLPGFAEGGWWVQDVSAAIPARLLGAQKHKTVLDLCAAPGGKTAQLALAGADVTALDVSEDRMGRVEANLLRLELGAELVVADALAYNPGAIFDGVLLDAPCSSTGTFRRHPEVLWHRDAGGIAERVAMQRKMLAHASGLVKSGGKLVYCVCSLEAEEGEDHLDWIADALPGFEIDPIIPAELDGWSDPILPTGALRLTPATHLPNAVNGGLDGFFAVRLIKK